MLSLKNAYLQPVLRPAKALVDLPSEIIDLILQYLYQDSGGRLDSLFAVSRSCRHVRASSYPILFERFTISGNADVIDRRSWESLQNLAFRPHLMKHIRSLRIRVAVEPNELPREADIRSARMGQVMSRKRLIECMALMTGLRSLKLHYLSEMIFEVLEQLTNTGPLHIALDLRWSTYVDRRETARLRHLVTKSLGWTLSMALPPASLIPGHDDVGLAISIGKASAIDWCDNWEALYGLEEEGYGLPNLEEMHISSRILEVQESLYAPGLIPWTTIKRLHVEGDRQTVLLLSSNIEGLVSLEDLRLHPSTTDAFHKGCMEQTQQSPQEPLSYTKLPSLRHLSLRAICPHIHPRLLTTPNLRTLILTLPEYHARLRNLTEARSPAEIRWLANNLPHLSHLELHIGPLENLWHPTAIPGVEVDVEVYLALQEITRFTHLHTLRLFPPYVPRTADHDYLNARQPLSDEQAVRVFRHLQTQCPTLRILSIAATFYTLRGFAPMSWLVRSNGGGSSNNYNSRGGTMMTLMTTYQAGKNYELEQTWVGERRLSTKTRRHADQRPYLTDLTQGDRRTSWTFTVEDGAVTRWRLTMMGIAPTGLQD